MSWHILPSGTKLFCVLSMELLGVENPVFSSPFHQGGGRAAKQPALPTLSLFHPAKTGRLEFLRTVVPTTGEGPVGSLDPAHWAKGCSSAQALLMSRPLGRDRSLENQVLQVIPEHPLRAGCLLHLNIGASGSCQQGTSLLLCSVSRYVKTNTPTVHRGRLWGLALQRRFLKPAPWLCVQTLQDSRGTLNILGGPVTSPVAQDSAVSHTNIKQPMFINLLTNNFSHWSLSLQ